MEENNQSIREKMGLLELARKLNNVTRACAMLGYSRDSYYRFKDLYDRGGEQALSNLSRRKPVTKNRVSREVEEEVVASAFAHPAWGQERTAKVLKARGVQVSSSGVRSIWQRYDLETRAKRGVAIGIRAEREGLPLSQEQMSFLRDLKNLNRSSWLGEAGSPGAVLYQTYSRVIEDSCFGSLHQHVVVDGYSRYAFVGLEHSLAPTSPAAFLGSRVLPWLEGQGLRALKVRTDRRAPFAGQEGAGYRQMLARENIELTYRLKPKARQSDPCADFLKLLRTDFYQKAFRHGLATDVDELRARLCQWLQTYNEERRETRASSYGETPAGAVARYVNRPGARR